MSYDSPQQQSSSLVAKTGMKWLEILEREFDTAFVDLDVCLGHLDEDSQDIAFDARTKMTALSAAFAQLAHKSSLVFDANSRYENLITSLREQLAQEKASVTALTDQLKEMENILKESSQTPSYGSRRASTLHTLSPSKRAPNASLNSTIHPDHLKQINSLKNEVEILRKENSFLRNQMIVFQGDLFGARLAAKYLDKELAGRIQQIQLLAKSDLRGIEHDRLWNQLEAEIHLHRHKTIVRACRTKSQYGQSKFPPPVASGLKRQVEIKKLPSEGLGISITGGKEHGIPIIISEVHPGSPAQKSGCLYVGDAILSVNGTDLQDLKHNDAVRILSSQPGNCIFEVIYLSPDDSSTSNSNGHNDKVKDESEIKYHYFDPDIMGPELIAAIQDARCKPSEENNDDEQIKDDNKSDHSLSKSTTNSFKEIYPGVAKLCLDDQQQENVNLSTNSPPKVEANGSAVVNPLSNGYVKNTLHGNDIAGNEFSNGDNNAINNVKPLVNNHWKVPQGVSYSKKETTID